MKNTVHHNMYICTTWAIVRWAVWYVGTYDIKKMNGLARLRWALFCFWKNIYKQNKHVTNRSTIKRSSLMKQCFSLEEAGIKLNRGKRILLLSAKGFPVGVLFLRDDDIPQSVANGVADIGIVGENEYVEKRAGKLADQTFRIQQMPSFHSPFRKMKIIRGWNGSPEKRSRHIRYWALSG